MSISVLWLCAGLTSVSATLIAWNLFLLRKLDSPDQKPDTGVSVLIPARDEEDNIEAALRSVLSNKDVELEIVVMDDGSNDQTAEIVARIAAADSRVTLHSAPELPSGWVGKQHACHQLAKHARYPLMLFMDADVRLAGNALGRIVCRLQESDLDLISGFPHQVTTSFAEKLLMPLIHFLLIGYLPIWGMRATRWVGFAAGCGQLIAVKKEAYQKAGGHGAIKQSMHDGIMLPRKFRKAGLRTDIFDADDLATCRMYSDWPEVRQGLSKNATEGMATLLGLPIWTLLLGGGHIAPFLLAPVFLASGQSALTGTATLLALFSLLQRFVVAQRFRQSRLGSLLHPAGLLILLVIQWLALFKSFRGDASQWRGREYKSD